MIRSIMCEVFFFFLGVPALSEAMKFFQNKQVLHLCPLFVWSTHVGVSENHGTPKIINFNRVFHYKPSILGYPYFWKHPYHEPFPNSHENPPEALRADRSSEARCSSGSLASQFPVKCCAQKGRILMKHITKIQDF